MSGLEPRFYNRALVELYVYQHVKQYDPAFGSYAGAAGQGGGGDCTNFASQALYAGGWPMKYGMAHSVNSWWNSMEGQPTGSWYEHYISGKASNTWASGAWFYRFLMATPERVQKCELSDLTIGDIVQGRDPEFNLIEHTMIVTSKRKDDVGVSYHTNDVWDASLNEKKVHFGELVYWKVKDIFQDPDPFEGVAAVIS